MDMLIKFTWRGSGSNVASVQKPLELGRTCWPTSSLFIRKRKPSSVRSLAVEGSTPGRIGWRITCVLPTGRPNWYARRPIAVLHLFFPHFSTSTWWKLTEMKNKRYLIFCKIMIKVIALSHIFVNLWSSTVKVFVINILNRALPLVAQVFRLRT